MFLSGLLREKGRRKMNKIFQDSTFLGVAISLLTYGFGSFLKKKTKLGIFNPLLISIIITIMLSCKIKCDKG